MRMKVDKEFVEICQAIAAENKTLEEWALLESDDCFSSINYVGGFDETEMAFCFSYYDSQKREFWFQITLEEVSQILTNKLKQVKLREAI